MSQRLLIFLMVISIGLSLSTAASTDSSNPFVDDKAEYSISIAIHPDGSHSVNYWGAIKSGSSFDKIKTFDQVYHADVQNMPPDLIQFAIEIAYDRVLPWYSYSQGKSPLLLRCRSANAGKFVCHHHLTNVVDPDATVSKIVEDIENTLPDGAEYYFETADGKRSPAQPFSSLVENGKAISDEDGDGIYDSFDNCVSDFNPKQEDGDGDGVGDGCVDAVESKPHDELAVSDTDKVDDPISENNYEDLDVNRLHEFDGGPSCSMIVR